MIKLSILVLTLPTRRDNVCQRLLSELEKQIGEDMDIEVLCLYDNRRSPIGEKRNMLLSLARGEYLTFIDDDDMVSNDYILEIMKVIRSNDSTNPIDCITFVQNYYDRGQFVYKCLYSKNYEYTSDKRNKLWTGKPSHTMIWRSEIAKQHSFPNIQNGEDVDWCRRVSELIKREHFIDKVLYNYTFDISLSESAKPF